MAIQYAAEQSAQGHVSGIDYSETMVRVAHKRNAAAIRNGLVDLRQGDVRSLPYGDEEFDRAFTIHCLYFWAEPTKCLREVRRVLRPKGVLAITILPKTNSRPDAGPPLMCLPSIIAAKLRIWLPMPVFRRRGWKPISNRTSFLASVSLQSSNPAIGRYPRIRACSRQRKTPARSQPLRQMV